MGLGFRDEGYPSTQELGTWVLGDSNCSTGKYMIIGKLGTWILKVSQFTETTVDG